MATSFGDHNIILDQELIEKVQRRATRLMYDLQNRTYNNCLSALNLPSLKFRRLCGDTIKFYKLMHNHFDLDISNLFSTATLLTSMFL